MSRTPPYFEYSERYKSWYGLYLMLTDGLEEPSEGNIKLRMRGTSPSWLIKNRLPLMRISVNPL